MISNPCNAAPLESWDQAKVSKWNQGILGDFKNSWRKSAAVIEPAIPSKDALLRSATWDLILNK